MVVSAPMTVPRIGDRMKQYLASSFTLFYRLLLKVYPPAYRAEFADEMYGTFIEGVEEAGSQGRLGRFLLRELRDTPKALARAYWDGWRTKVQIGIQILQDAASTSDLPPAPPDGRDSWRQVFWELSPFITTALFLLLVTYLPFGGVNAGWQRDIEFLGKIIVPLTLPIFLLGLLRGLPRWAYPFGGLLLGYQVLMARQTSLWLFLVTMLLASFVLALAAIITDPQPSLLPIPLRRIGQSLSLDWTRFSFALYGTLPLMIILAFDDSRYNNRTPYLAFSVLMMVVSALIYCRSRETTTQVAALLLGVTLCIWGAWLDRISFPNGLMNWIVISSQGSAGGLWLLELWIRFTILILFPVLLVTFSRAMYLKRAI